MEIQTHQQLCEQHFGHSCKSYSSPALDELTRPALIYFLRKVLTSLSVQYADVIPKFGGRNNKPECIDIRLTILYDVLCCLLHFGQVPNPHLCAYGNAILFCLYEPIIFDK